MAIDRPSQPRPDDTPAAHGDQAKRIDQPDRTTAATTADQAAPRAETRSRRQYLTEIRSGPMARHDTPSPDNRTASRDNRPADAAPRNQDGHHREHNTRGDRSGHEAGPDNPRSADGQARPRDPDRPATYPDRFSIGPERSQSTDHFANNRHASDGERIDAPNRSDSAGPKDERTLNTSADRSTYEACRSGTHQSGDRSSEPVLREDQLAADPASGKASALDNHKDKPGLLERGDDRPSAEDLGRWHSMYQEFRDEHAEAAGGWERGTNVIGDKPERSPDDITDLPPTGEQLLEMEDDDAPRLEKLGKKIYEEFGDITDVGEKVSNRAQQLFDRPPPTGQPEVQVPAGPLITPVETHHATPDAGNITQLGLVLGVLGFQTYRLLHRKLTELRGR